MQELAEQRGGKCLSTEYGNNTTKLKFQCKDGHVWEAIPQAIKGGKEWCPKCANKTRGPERLTIEEMQELAQLRGGKCLSPEYTNVDTKLKWQCKEGHVWEATPDSIKLSKRWCPECANGLSERVCRNIFETIFSTKFPKTRPKWLINSQGNVMELDGYNEELSLAFEYHGIQHYEFHTPFHNSLEGFERRKGDDAFKKELCEKKGVILIEVPYTLEYTK